MVKCSNFVAGVFYLPGPTSLNGWSAKVGDTPKEAGGPLGDLEGTKGERKDGLSRNFTEQKANIDDLQRALTAKDAELQHFEVEKKETEAKICNICVRFCEVAGHGPQLIC